MKRLMILVVLVLCGGAMAMAAPTMDMQVTATLNATFTVVSAGPLAFGAWSLGEADKLASAGIVVQATPTTSYKVTLGNGLNFAGSTRNVSDGTNSVPYQIYFGSPSGTEWIGTAGPTGTGSGSNTTYTAYGTLHNNAAITAVPGAYADTVVVTIATP